MRFWLLFQGEKCISNAFYLFICISFGGGTLRQLIIWDIEAFQPEGAAAYIHKYIKIHLIFQQFESVIVNAVK